MDLWTSTLINLVLTCVEFYQSWAYDCGIGTMLDRRVSSSINLAHSSAEIEKPWAYVWQLCKIVM